MDEHTPTTGDVKAHYCFGRMVSKKAAYERGSAEFDRWLAAHDRAVKAEAWDEAVEWAAEHTRQIKAWRATGGHYTPDHEDEYNPYRDEATA